MTPQLERLHKARTRLMLTNEGTFFGVLASRLIFAASTKIETCATDGVFFYYNVAWVDAHDDDELEYTVAHEAYHCGNKHHVRRGNRDPYWWNVACDHVVNIDVSDAKIGRMPEGCFRDYNFRGMSAEDVYVVVHPQDDQQDDEQSEDDQQEEEGDDTQEDTQPQGGGNGSDADDEDDSDSDDDAGGEGDAASDADEDAGSESESGSDADEDGEGAGSEDGADGESGSASNAREPSTPSIGDVGGCGEILDAPGDAAEQAQQDAEWDVTTREAINAALKAGNAPGFVKGLQTRLSKPTVNWRDALHRFIDQSQRFDYSFARPDRRFQHAGFILPGPVVDGVNHAAIILDTSGSVYHEKPQAAFKTELQSLLDLGVVDKLTVIYCDVRVTGFAEFSAGDQLDFRYEPKGGGGTRFSPAFEHVERELPDVSAIVYFTDMECFDFGPAPTAPVLWAAYGDTRFHKNVPFGEIVTIDPNA